MRAASPERRRLLGRRLRERREDELGYPTRKGGRRAFEDATGWDQRNSFDIEKAKRSNFKEETLREAARVYQVARESMIAFLCGEADELVPAAPAPARPGPPAARLGPSPITDAAVAAAAQPIADAIWERLVALVYEMHIPARDIPGASLFGAGTDDARDWDDERRKRLLTVSERVYLIANLRVLEHSNNRSALAPVMAVMVAR
jgi:hypothetical protein